ncbi:cation transporter [Geobacter grbiciae]|uniref:cation transporter n=1 Tax=Geobacter grbiciae TaxID=155042 RepID=UPI001C0290EE|nr:cation transporter [Geobacter grbiciae]MBT1075327.1 cation transporter [Geobacter grbiciae]
MLCDKFLRLQELYRKAAILALITISYNIIEGIVSVWFGAADETLSLFGFGLDSFVEVISGVGIWHMVRRLRRGEEEKRDSFERRALRITGGAFYLLAAGLVVTAGLSIYSGHRPETTVWGIVVSLVSISFMWLLIRHKMKVGKALNSPAILADAACSRACLLLSVVLLAASAGYELTGIGYLDSLGSLAIAWLAFREGREAFGKADGMACSCSCACGAAEKS